MSEVYARPEPTLIPIPRPLSPACQSRMMLIRVGASCDGPNIRIFECSRCGNVHKNPRPSRLEPGPAVRFGTGTTQSIAAPDLIRQAIMGHGEAEPRRKSRLDAQRFPVERPQEAQG
jgi:hypothetical protein